jgi:hypothetical protein
MRARPVGLLTVHILEGFLPIPNAARSMYPPLAPGEGPITLLRGMWYEDGTSFRLWLNRTKHDLYGPELAARLMEMEAGRVLRIEWAPDVIVMRQLHLDEEVRRQETRLIDLEVLAVWRGGLGENYRRSVQAILEEAPNGLRFAEIVTAMRERQQHEIHRGGLHALLYSGGFIQKERRWFAAPDEEAGARQLRAAFVEALLPDEQKNAAQPLSTSEHLHARVQAIHTRLREIVTLLR